MRGAAPTLLSVPANGRTGVSVRHSSDQIAARRRLPAGAVRRMLRADSWCESPVEPREQLLLAAVVVDAGGAEGDLHRGGGLFDCHVVIENQLEDFALTAR